MEIEGQIKFNNYQLFKQLFPTFILLKTEKTFRIYLKITKNNDLF